MCGTKNRYRIASSSVIIQDRNVVLIGQRIISAKFSLSLKNTFYWTIANLNFTKSKYCMIMIIKRVKFQRNCMSGKFHIRIQFFVQPKSLLFVLFTMMMMKYNWWKNSRKIGLHMVSNSLFNYGVFASFIICISMPISLSVLAKVHDQQQ